MDILSILGLIVGFGGIIGGNLLEGGHISALLNLPAIIIVASGAFGAVMLQTPMPTFLRGLKMMAWVFMPPPVRIDEAIQKIIEWSQIARKEGLLGLEAIAEDEPHPFAKKGLQLVVDGGEPDDIREILEVELHQIEVRDLASAKIYEGLGGYTPTVGIIGAVLGLIHVMGNLADPARVGPGIAVAFVATIYGVALANLFFLPIAGKLRSCVREAAQYREMIIEGIIAIADGENPRAIELRLNGYLE